MLNNSSKLANPCVRRDPETCQRKVAGQGQYFPKIPETRNKNCLDTFNGIVEADETYVLESHKGDRNLDRKVRRRGGKASKPSLSDEQVPILVAVGRSGTTACSVLPSVTADSVQCALEPRIDDDILLVTDGNNVYPPCEKAVGIKHEALNQSAGERVRGAIHIQTVNNGHSGIKSFLRDYRGVSSPPFHREVRHLQVVEIVVKNFSMMGCDQGATTPSYWAGRLA